MNNLKFKIRSLQNNRSIRRLGQLTYDFAGSLFVIYLVIKNELLQPSILIYSLPLIHISINSYLGSYKSLWQYASLREIQNLIINILVCSSVLIAANALLEISLSTTGIITEAALFFLASIGIRALKRQYNSLKYSKTKTESPLKSRRTLFIGASKTTLRLIQEIKKEKTNLECVACLDDDRKKIGAELLNTPIIDSTNRIEHYIKKLNIDLVIIAIPSAPNHKMEEWISQIRRTQ